MANRKLIVEVVGDSRSLERSFARSTSASKKFGAETTTTFGKVEAGFTKMQRVAAGGFIGGAIAASGIAALKSFVDAAAESQKILGQTRLATEAAGKSWDVYGQQIEKAVTAQSKLGFDDENLLQTFSQFVRTTGDVNEALRDNQLAMDVARGSYRDLDSAAQIVNKALLGQAGALRRLGIDTKGATTPTELLARLQEKFGGAAEAASGDASTAMDRVNVSVENLKESMGTLLLPAVASLANGLSDAAEAASTLTTTLGKLGSVRIPAIKIPFTTEEVPGTGGTLGGLIGKVLSNTNVLAANPVVLQAKLAKALKDQFDGAKPKVQVAVQAKIDESPFTFKLPEIKLEPPEGFDQQKGVHFPGIADFGKNLQGAIQAAIDAADAAVAKGRKAIAAGNAKKAAQDAAAAAEKQRQAIQDAFLKILAGLELNVDKAGLGNNLQKQLAALETLKAGLQRQIKAGVDVQSAQSELVQVVGAIADKQAEIQAKMRDALQSSQFRGLGLTASGDALTPTVANLKRQLEQLSKNDLSSKAQSSLSRIGKVLSGSFGKVTEETRSAIKRMFDEIRGELDNGAKTLGKGPLTKTSALNSNKILEGLGLDRNTEKLLKARLSSFNSAGLGLGGKQPTLPSSPLGSAPVTVWSQVTVELDGDVVGRSVTKSQQKAGRRNPRQKRGPNTRSGV